MGCVQSESHLSRNQLTKPQIFFVLGGPGSGKGTQCDNIVRDYKFKHLSAGDLLREEKSKGGKNAEEIENYIKKGQLVPSQMIVKLLKKAISENGNRRYLIDGFPRNEENFNQFKTTFRDQIVIRNLIFFECPKEVMVERIKERGKTSGRSDDNQETIKLRLDTYERQTIPIVKKFQDQSNCITIDANQSLDKVYEEVKFRFSSIDVNVPPPITTFFVLGGPGSGKGTQCDLLVEKFGFKHLSTGDLLREEVKKGTKLGNDLNALMKEGKLVSSELLVNLVKNKIERNNYGGIYLIDGFPRNKENIEAWEKILSSNINLQGVLYFNCDDNELKRRLMNRGKTSGRADDNEETIAKRVQVFHNQTAPLIQYYQEKNKLVNFDASKTVDKIFAEVNDYMEKQGIQSRKKKDARTIVVVGGPGSGKGTQCQKMVANFGFHHLSTGDLLREEQKNNGLHSEHIAQKIKAGQMVSSELIVGLIRKQISKKGFQGTYLLDGFPRNQDNISTWNQQFGIQLEFTNLIYFECSQKELEKRLLERGKSSGRSDDNSDTIKKRLENFKKQTQPLLKKYQKKENFILKVNAQGTIEEVYESLKQQLVKAGYPLV